ncbi:hypothetical protein B9Z55_008874 [Caenorhabditis nigoni]|uniref:DNA2/NAM7 helicase-like C-terminal domain-containing protein n=1 Tax=Caenorhabditis nigoni TaxID=1611254 RepID=A0A2G5UPJ1_9PELO|nr:hypothetical protein B9Z55_008874 [Caenorhabditis nigoni]
MANVEYIVDKFLLLLKMSKIQHKDTQYPHVVLYFFFVMESEIKTVPLQPKEAVIFDFVGGSNDTRNELVKRMIFWLPIHLGDLAGTCHVPEPEMIGFVPRTIDASEGQEFHTVVICTTRTTPFHSVAKTQSTQNGTQEPDFIEDHRRLNVALSRTKQLCVILVDLKAARNSDKWSQFTAEERAAFLFSVGPGGQRLLPRNLGEAKYAKNLLNRGTDPENIALIAPYIGQCDLLKKLMDEHIEATGNGIWHNRQYGWPRI